MLLIKKPADIKYSEVTPKALYFNRRKFLTGIPVAFLSARELLSPSNRALAGTKLPSLAKSPFSTTEKENSYNDVTHYNNFYEFGVPKQDPARNAQNFKTTPWTVSVEGDVARPRKFSIDDLMHLAPLEERIYRHRCVEGWSIVVPWAGYSLSALLKEVEPTPKAKFVAFTSYYDPGQMPQARSSGLDFPYIEGLRIDEAMHPLCMLTLGMYGETLPPQDGAPVRLTVPWKYGFKSAKSLVKIRLVEKQPPCTWNIANPQEYGFYSNVNPAVDNPRYSQATERRLGELRRRPTLPFNGYADQVASLYTGMDLRKFY
jgi:sulfoxide reductase catalytic subunit YedY